MGKHSNKQAAAEQVSVEETATPVLSAEEQEIAKLREQLAAKMAEVEKEERGAWERKTAARNPALVLGSLRKATESDTKLLGHTHGEVCEILCSVSGCGVKRVVNKQDAFQVRYCETHKTEGRKAARKEKRELTAATPEALKAKLLKEIAKQEAKAAKLAPAAAAVDTDTASAS